MGVAIADSMAEEGAEVDLILGPSHVRPVHKQVAVHPVHTAREMHELAVTLFPNVNGAIMSAAVSDYRPTHQADQKMKREAGVDLTLTLTPNPDIAASLGQKKQADQILVGFALETENEEANALGKLKRKQLDFIVLNSLKDEGAGFGGDTNRIRILDSEGNKESFDLKPKLEVAKDIVDKLCRVINGNDHS